jgi:hypothetical protein
MSDQGSILNEVKKVLGMEPEYTAFDTDVIMHINSVFATLHQLGVGPSTPFQITDKEAKWAGFIDTASIASVKSYMWAKVRLMFDPPTTSFGIDALKGVITEFEWRLNVAGDRSSDD